MKVQSFKDLTVWQQAFSLCIKIYKITANFPKEELYGLTTHIKKTGVSVPSNIAEGHGRGTTKEYIHFLNIAYGSLCELETQLMLADALGFLSRSEEIFFEISAIGKMLNSLIRSLENKSFSPNPKP